MSIEVNLETSHKKEVADLLVAISNLIRISKNKRICIISNVEFIKEKESDAD